MDAEAIHDLLAEVGPVRIRRMFGGQGVFIDDMMFALEADGVLYIKADTETENVFSDAGSEKFSYAVANGKILSLGYWSLPDEALDDPSAAEIWARRGIEAARRAALAKLHKKTPVKRMKSGKAIAAKAGPGDLFAEFQIGMATAVKEDIAD